jgi:hypothetical protein
MEKITLAAPEVTPAITTTDYQLASLLLDLEASRIVVTLKGTNGERRQVIYEDAAATLKALNTANLTVKSLHRRVMEKLIADGKVAGTIAGTPDV